MPSKGAASPATILKQLDDIIEPVQREVEEKTSYLQSLVSARKAVARGVLKNVTSPRSTGERSGGNRTQMLKTILNAAPHPVTVDEIMAEMAKHGRSDDRRLVYSTLSYLRRSGLAKPAERGKWIAVTETTAKAA